jgi:hypothetical protein
MAVLVCQENSSCAPYAPPPAPDPPLVCPCSHEPGVQPDVHAGGCGTCAQWRTRLLPQQEVRGGRVPGGVVVVVTSQVVVVAWCVLAWWKYAEARLCVVGG